MEKTTTTTLKPFVLYKEDFEDLQQYLPKDGLTIQYYASSSGNDEEYSFESIEEMINTLDGKEVHSISLSYIGPSFKVVLGDYGTYIRTYGTPDIETLGRISAIEKICSRHRWYRKSIFNDFFINIGLLLFVLSGLFISIVQDKVIINPEIFEYCKYILVIPFLMYTVGLLARLPKNCFKACFYYSNNQPKGLLSNIKRIGLEEVIKTLVFIALSWVLSHL